jgi:hypothetical protein
MKPSLALRVLRFSYRLVVDLSSSTPARRRFSSTPFGLQTQTDRDADRDADTHVPIATPIATPIAIPTPSISTPPNAQDALARRLNASGRPKAILSR